MFKSRGDMTKIRSKYVKATPKTFFTDFRISAMSPGYMEYPRCIAHLEASTYCPLT